MDSEGYPELHELEKIENWDYKDVFNLLDYIYDLWFLNKLGGFKKSWGRDCFSKPVLNLQLHTQGWSGNEDVIEAVLKNRMFQVMCYTEWKRGGHYYFEIKPHAIGYKKVAEFSKEKGISKHQIYNNKEAYDWVSVGERLKLIRPKQQ